MTLNPESSSITRRTAVKTLAASCLAAATATSFAHSQDSMPKSGSDDPAFATFDDVIVPFMREHKIPGASLAVTRHGRLAYARGYGWGNAEAQTPYAPTNLFRIASLSKSITSAAVMTLVQAGKIGLDDPAFALLHLEAHIEPDQSADPRLNAITIRQLLHHTGGFDRDASYDPMFACHRIATALGEPSPPNARSIIRYMMGQPLDFAPGAKYAYSNFGYCVLGRVIEVVSGKAYDQAAQEAVLQPAGITRMRLGRSHFADRAPNEVRYYDGADRRAASVFANDNGRLVPVPYGAWNIEAMDSHGGWLASVVDLARFAAALDATKNPSLNAASRRTLYERPAPPVGMEPNGAPAAAFYGMGWMVRPTRDGRANYWHSGKLDGSSSLLVRRSDGLSWVLNFNSESVSDSFASMLDGPLHGAANAVRSWPDHDLFPQFGIT